MVTERRASQGERPVVAVGLTGSIGAGKSTALEMFGECGAVILSADALVHTLYTRSEVVSTLAAHFGQEVVGDDGRVDRARLAEAVRGDTEELHWLEELTHPLVDEEIVRQIEAARVGSLVVCEVPLMFETGFERLFDLVVSIEAAPEVRRDRSIHGFGLEQFGEFEALQASQEQRAAGSDLVYVNDGSLEDLRAFVLRVCEHARGMLTPGHDMDAR